MYGWVFSVIGTDRTDRRYQPPSRLFYASDEAIKRLGGEVSYMSKEMRFIILTLVFLALIAGGTFLMFYFGGSMG